MSITEDRVMAFIFAAFGLMAVVLGQGYGTGTPSRMGAGFVPTLVGGGLLLMAAILALRSVRVAGAAFVVTLTELRVLIGVIAAVSLFAILLERAGLIVSIAVLVVTVRLADTRRGWLDLAVTALILIALSISIFVYGLGMSMPLGF